MYREEWTHELVKKYPESLLNVNMIDMDSKNTENEIANYMANEYGSRWKNRCVVVNGNEYKLIVDSLHLNLIDIQYNDSSDRIECIVDHQYESIIQSFSAYLQNNSLGDELRSTVDRKLLNSILSEYPLDMNNQHVQSFFYPIYSPFLKESIINEQQYDSYLREWLGNDSQWKLLYRASENEYSAKSFHNHCDNISPTFILIKSKGGWIFGGYTTQSWVGDGI